MIPIPVGGDVRIPPGEGLLVVETISNSKIESLRLKKSHGGEILRLLKNIPSGHQFQLVSLPEGDYRWSRIELPGWVYRNRTYPVQWRLERDEQWQVSIKAGQVNYPGVVILHRSAWSYLSYRVLNRSGELLATIEELYPGLLTQYGIRYGGAGRDDFLEYYQEALRSVSFGETSADAEVSVAPTDD